MGNASSNQQPECCPPGSLPTRSAAQAGAASPTTGEEIQLDPTTKAYVARPPEGKQVEGAVLLFHDIFGYDSARTHHLADEIASWGYLVLAPDCFGPELDGVKEPEDIGSIWTPWRYFTGGGSIFFRRVRQPFSIVENKVRTLCLPWLEANGAKGKRVGLLGFCWGGWAITRLAAFPDLFACAVGAHPGPMVQYFQSEGPTKVDMFKAVKVPVLYLPAGNDYLYKESGSAWQTIKQASPESKCIEFPNMIHGWMNRGDIRLDTIKPEVEAAMRETRQFFDKYVLQSKM